MVCNYLVVYFFGILVCFVADIVACEAIVGGDKAKVHQFPYHVSVMFDNQNECGGGIIDEQFIITVAHCVLTDYGDFVNQSISILAGTNDLNKNNKLAIIVEAKKIYVPKEYDSANINSPGDIAILKLEHSLELSCRKYLRRLELPEHKNENYIDDTATIAGFGWHWVKVKNNYVKGGSHDTQLRFAVIDILSKGQRGYHPRTDVEKQISGRVKQRDNLKRGICEGDSGSPLVYNGTIVVGVLSVGPRDCSEKKTGALYTRVSYYLDFIDYAMKDIRSRNIRTHVLRS